MPSVVSLHWLPHAAIPWAKPEACHVPKDLCYVVPGCEAELHAQIYFYPEGCHRRSIYEIYREAWCQMACPRDGADPTCIKVERRCEREAGIGNCALRGR